MLNGKLLRPEATRLGELPPLLPLTIDLGAEVQAGREASVTVAPLSVSYLVFPNARIPACM